MYKII